MQAPAGGCEFSGYGPQLLRNFRLRLQLQLLPAADLRVAAESKQLHLQRLLEASSGEGKAAVPAGAPRSEIGALQLMLQRAEQQKETEVSSPEAPKVLASDISGALALPSYRLHMAAALHEDLKELGWGEGPLNEYLGEAPHGDRPSVGTTHEVDEASRRAGLALSTRGEARATPCSSQKEYTGGTYGVGGGIVSSALGTPYSGEGSIAISPAEPKGPYVEYQEQQGYGGGISSRIVDSATEGSATSALSRKVSTGSLAIQQKEQRQQQQPQDPALEEEMLLLREQVASLQLRQQQQQRECAAAAAAAAALRLRVQELLEENRSLRLHSQGVRGWRQMISSGEPPLSADSQHLRENSGRGVDCLSQKQQQEQPDGEAASAIETLKQKVAVYRRELMLLSEQNARLRTQKAGGDPPPSQQQQPQMSRQPQL